MATWMQLQRRGNNNPNAAKHATPKAEAPRKTITTTLPTRMDNDHNNTNDNEHNMNYTKQTTKKFYHNGTVILRRVN